MNVLTVRGFLLQLQKRLRKSGVLEVVCGNESADFDSIAAAIGYAYAMFPQRMLIPIIDIPRSDLALRRDVVFALGKLQIPESLLYFREDLHMFRHRYERLHAILVDHNVLFARNSGIFDQIVGIIDHHKDEEMYAEVKPRIVEKTGSCSSLVVLQWHHELPSLAPMNLDVTCLLLGAILLDTSNLKSKTEATDVEAAEICQSILVGINKDEYYTELKRAKDDIKGLSMQDVLRKDYKEFYFPSKSGQQLKVGMSSIVKSFGWLYDNYGDVHSECLAYQKQNDLDILVLMTAWRDNDNKFQRELGVLSKERQIAQQLINSISEPLKLQESLATSDVSAGFFKTFSQENTLASRKQVAPSIGDALAAL